MILRCRLPSRRAGCRRCEMKTPRWLRLLGAETCPGKPTCVEMCVMDQTRMKTRFERSGKKNYS